MGKCVHLRSFAGKNMAPQSKKEKAIEKTINEMETFK